MGRQAGGGTRSRCSEVMAQCVADMWGWQSRAVVCGDDEFWPKATSSMDTRLQGHYAVCGALTEANCTRFLSKPRGSTELAGLVAIASEAQFRYSGGGRVCVFLNL